MGIFWAIFLVSFWTCAVFLSESKTACPGKLWYTKVMMIKKYCRFGTSYTPAPAALSCAAKEMPGQSDTEMSRARASLVVDYIKDRS